MASARSTTQPGGGSFALSPSLSPSALRGSSHQPAPSQRAPDGSAPRAERRPPLGLRLPVVCLRGHRGGGSGFHLQKGRGKREEGRGQALTRRSRIAEITAVGFILFPPPS